MLRSRKSYSCLEEQGGKGVKLSCTIYSHNEPVRSHNWTVTNLRGTRMLASTGVAPAPLAQGRGAQDGALPSKSFQAQSWSAFFITVQSTRTAEGTKRGTKDVSLLVQLLID